VVSGMKEEEGDRVTNSRSNGGISVARHHRQRQVALRVLSPWATRVACARKIASGSKIKSGRGNDAGSMRMRVGLGRVVLAHISHHCAPRRRISRRIDIAPYAQRIARIFAPFSPARATAALAPHSRAAHRRLGCRTCSRRCAA